MGIDCAACGAQNPARARFCLECGTALAAAAPSAETRKTVTVLFCDVTGSTALGESRDAEAMRAVMGRYFAAMAHVIEAHGGTVEKFIGDAVMAVFGVPVLHEDDALRAVRAAAGMREALAGLNDTLDRDHGVRLGVRIGVNTGEVVVGAGAPGGPGMGGKGTVATGDAVNVAARLEQAADPGEVLLGRATWDLVRHHTRTEPVDPISARGKTRGVPAWRLLEVEAADTGPARHQVASPLVGRDRELQLLAQAMERSRADRRTQLVTVLGAAGVGKSRLVDELVGRHAGDATVLASRCLSYGEDIVFWPLQQMLRQAAGLTATEDDETGRSHLRALVADEQEPDRVVERLAPLAGLRGTPAEADETHWALRRLVESLGRRAPVVLVLDDIHWAEPALLDAVEHLADWTRDTPLLLVCLARPEFLDDRPHWGGGKLNATTVLLEPLAVDAAEALLDNLLAGARLDPTTRLRILSAASGMPLYVEQILAMLVDDGLLVRDGDTYRPTRTSEPVDIPRSISALLAARLDRLPPADRSALEAASVIGTTFYLDGVAELTESPTGDVGRALMSLTRKELVRPDRSDLPGEDGFRFLHVLVRDAAYAEVPKGRRADLHERFARWLDKRAETLGLDVDQFVGHHLEQTVHLRDDLGPRSAQTRETARTAAARLADAARGLGAADPAASGSLFSRAAALLDAGDPTTVDLLRRSATAFTHSGDLPAALARYEQALVVAQTQGDDRGAELCSIDLIAARGFLEPGQDALAGLEVVDAALARFRAARDDEGVLTAGKVKLILLNELAQWGAMVDLATELMPVADRSGDELARDMLDSHKGMALTFGPAPCEEALAWNSSRPQASSRLTELGRTFGRAALLAHLDRADDARRELARGEDLLAQLPTPMAFVDAAFGAGEALTELGELDDAERVRRRGLQALRSIGERSYLSTLAPMLGLLRFDLGDRAEARRLALEGRDLAPPNDRYSQALWRALLARVESAEGHPDRAVRLADEAVDWAERGDQLASVAEVRSYRAEVLAAAGQVDRARDDLLASLEAYQRKGSRTGVRRVRAQLSALAGPGAE